MEEIKNTQDQLIRETQATIEANLEDLIHSANDVLEKTNLLVQTDLDNKLTQFRVECYRILSNSSLYDSQTLQLCDEVANETQQHKQRIESERELIRSWFLDRVEEEKEIFKSKIDKFDQLKLVAQINLEITAKKYKSKPDEMSRELQEDLQALKRSVEILKSYTDKDFSTCENRLTLLNRELNIKVQKLLAQSNEEYEKIIRKVRELPYYFRPCKVTRFGIKARTFCKLSFHLTDEQKLKAKANIPKLDIQTKESSNISTPKSASSNVSTPKSDGSNVSTAKSDKSSSANEE